MGAQARTEARLRRQAKVLAEQRARRRNRLLGGAGGLVIVGLLVAIVVSLVNSAGQAEPSAAAASKGPLVTPASAMPGGAIPIGAAAAPVRVEIYLDYMCPYCGRFERANGVELRRLVADGTVRVELHPLAFLDRASAGTRYSTRAANAVATVADRAPDRVLAFSEALYENQPAEGSAGLSNDEIALRAANAGVPGTVVGAFAVGTFEPWVATTTTAAFDGGVTGTPTVKINGAVFKGDLYTVGPLTQAIAAAKGQ
jgi:protein-disulfide isomerase